MDTGSWIALVGLSASVIASLLAFAWRVGHMEERLKALGDTLATAIAHAAEVPELRVRVGHLETELALLRTATHKIRGDVTEQLATIIRQHDP